MNVANEKSVFARDVEMLLRSGSCLTEILLDLRVSVRVAALISMATASASSPGSPAGPATPSQKQQGTKGNQALIKSAATGSAVILEMLSGEAMLMCSAVLFEHHCQSHWGSDLLIAILYSI